jgi:hypothetical protein
MDRWKERSNKWTDGRSAVTNALLIHLITVSIYIIFHSPDFIFIIDSSFCNVGYAAGSAVGMALRQKSEGRGFDSRW